MQTFKMGVVRTQTIREVASFDVAANHVTNAWVKLLKIYEEARCDEELPFSFSKEELVDTQVHITPWDQKTGRPRSPLPAHHDLWLALKRAVEAARDCNPLTGPELDEFEGLLKQFRYTP